MTRYYEQAILSTLKAIDRPLLMREIVDLIAPGNHAAFGAIGNTLTKLHRDGRVAREKPGRWYAYSYLAEPAQATSADAALLAELSAMRAELLAVKVREQAMRGAIERYLGLSPDCDFVGGEPDVCPGVAKDGYPCHWCDLRAALQVDAGEALLEEMEAVKAREQEARAVVGAVRLAVAGEMSYGRLAGVLAEHDRLTNKHAEDPDTEY